MTVTLRNAQGRDGRVAWDTLRDRASGRIRLSYGDVLTIDATQGLTSTEHIEAMPAGTQAVNAYKAYTAGSRHRRATFLVVAEGTERREIAGRRPLGDTRLIHEGDVWANMGRNLSRQPEQEGALAFLERAHAVRRSATAALQAGLQPAEQRQAEGLAPTTVAAAMQRRRVVARVADMAERLAAWTSEQGAVLDGLARLGPALQDAVVQAVERLRPAVQQAAQRIRQRPERVAARQREAEVAALQGELLEARMRRFRADQRWGWTTVNAGMQRGFDTAVQAEQVLQRQNIAALNEAELRSAVRHERMTQQRRIEREQEAAMRIKGPKPGM